MSGTIGGLERGQRTQFDPAPVGVFVGFVEKAQPDLPE